MPTAQRTPAGEALRAMLPAGTDPYATIDLACHTAFLARDRDILPGILDVAKTDPGLAASLIVTLASLVDVDSRAADMLAWLGPHDSVRQSARQLGAMAQARAESGETLPPVTLQTMRELAHAARVAGVAQPCGTVGAYSRHIKNGEKPCPRCSHARWWYDRASPEERKLLKTPLPGTAGANLAVSVVAATATGTGNRRKKPAENPTRLRRSCGSHTGYNAHRRELEDPCARCAEAQRLWDARHYDERLARQGKTRTRSVSPQADSGPPAVVVPEGVLVVAPERRRRNPLKRPNENPTQIRLSCGSHKGYNAHRSNLEEPCERCDYAQRVWDAKRYDERLARQGKTRKRGIVTVVDELAQHRSAGQQGDAGGQRRQAA